MITRSQYLYYKSKLAKSKEYVSNFRRSLDPKHEIMNNIYREWCEYLAMLEEDEAKLLNEWNEYYDAVRQLYTDAGFFRLKELMMSEAHGGSLRSACDELRAKIDKSKLPAKPLLKDPVAWKHDSNINSYLRMLSRVKELEDIIEEYSEVYGSKQAGSSSYDSDY